jgi:hypothetical protein
MPGVIGRIATSVKIDGDYRPRYSRPRPFSLAKLAPGVPFVAPLAHGARCDLMAKACGCPLGEDLCQQWMKAQRCSHQVTHSVVLRSGFRGQPRYIFRPVTPRAEKIGKDNYQPGPAGDTAAKRRRQIGRCEFHVGRFHNGHPRPLG